MALCVHFPVNDEEAFFIPLQLIDDAHAASQKLVEAHRLNAKNMQMREHPSQNACIHAGSTKTNKHCDFPALSGIEFLWPQISRILDLQITYQDIRIC